MDAVQLKFQLFMLIVSVTCSLSITHIINRAFRFASNWCLYLYVDFVKNWECELNSIMPPGFPMGRTRNKEHPVKCGYPSVIGHYSEACDEIRVEFRSPRFA